MRIRKLETLKDTIKSAYENGATLELLSMSYGVSIGTVRNILIRLNVPLRKPGRPQEK